MTDSDSIIIGDSIAGSTVVAYYNYWRKRVDELSMVGWFLKQPHIRAQKTQLQMQIEESGHYMIRHARFWAALFNFIEMMFGRSKLLTRGFCTHKMADLKRAVPVSLGMEQLNTKYRQPYHNGSEYHMTAELVAKYARISRQRIHLAKRQLLAGVPGIQASEEQIAAYLGGNRTAIKSHPGQRGAYRPAAEGETH